MKRVGFLKRNPETGQVLGSGNSWESQITYNCRRCGTDNLCDVCHEHDMPRGECSECPKGKAPE